MNIINIAITIIVNAIVLNFIFIEPNRLIEIFMCNVNSRIYNSDNYGFPFFVL